MLAEAVDSVVAFHFGSQAVFFPGQPPDQPGLAVDLFCLLLINAFLVTSSVFMVLTATGSCADSTGLNEPPKVCNGLYAQVVGTAPFQPTHTLRGIHRVIVAARAQSSKRLTWLLRLLTQRY